MFKSKWTLDEARSTMCFFETTLIMSGWHCALGGGVLFKGRSIHDLDVIVYPHDITSLNHDWTWKDVHLALGAAGWTLYRDSQEMHRLWAARGFTDRKHVEVWVDPQGRRVDFLRFVQ